MVEQPPDYGYAPYLCDITADLCLRVNDIVVQYNILHGFVLRSMFIILLLFGRQRYLCRGGMTYIIARSSSRPCGFAEHLKHGRHLASIYRSVVDKLLRVSKFVDAAFAVRLFHRRADAIGLRPRTAPLAKHKHTYAVVVVVVVVAVEPKGTQTFLIAYKNNNNNTFEIRPDAEIY